MPSVSIGGLGPVGVRAPSGFRALRGCAQVYVGVVTTAGFATLIAFVPLRVPNPLLFATLVIVACLTSAWKVTLPISVANGSTLSVSYAANLMTLLLLGPQAAVVASVAGVWTQCTYKAKEPYPAHRTLFSMATAVLSMAASGATFGALGGQVAPVDALLLARPLAAAIGVYFLVNTLLVAGAIAMSTRRSFVATWREDFLWSSASFMVAGSAGALAAVVIARGAAWEAAFLVAPVYLTYRTYELFVGRLDDERRHADESRALQQETMRALNQVREAEYARDQHLAREQAARAAAEQASRIKDEVLAVVSHELRTPLTSILGWSDMLRLGLLPDAAKPNAVQTIFDSASKQAQLIEDLLDVSRIAAGKLRLERDTVMLVEPLHAALQVVTPAADAKGVRIELDVDPAVGAVWGDAARLQQVLWNLLSNAVKFTPRGGRVSVRLRGSDDGAEIVVSDTGQGIAPEFLPRVFDAFRQEDGSTTRVQPGLGLGLSIVKSLVEAHGGTITAQSDGRDLGATFVVVLPTVVPAMDGRSAVSRPQRAATAAPVSLGGVTVLVVDDDEETREVVAAHLRCCEADVLTAPSAPRAFELLMDRRVDVLLADIAMPGEDGYSLIRRVRASAGPAAAVPAAALTAFAREEDRNRALEAGFQMHLTKPIDAQALAAAVTNLSSVRVSA